MNLPVLNDFSFLTFLAGLLFTVTGLIYKFCLPQKMKPWNAMQLKSARRSEEAWRKTIKFSAVPALLAGSVLIMAGLLSYLYPDLLIFTFRSAIFLIIVSSLILIFLINRHLNRHFDAEGKQIP